MKLSGILLLFLSGCLIQTMGQETARFQADPTLFIQEARAFFGTQQPENARALLSKLETAQKNGLINNNHWIDIARKANMIEKIGVPPFPDFYLVINTVLEVAQNVKNWPDYQRWSVYLDQLLVQNKKSIARAKPFLELTISLSQKGVIYQSNAFHWKVKPGLYGCGMDSAFFFIINQSNLTAVSSGDSSVILSTRGKFYPETNLFYGDGGQVTWEKLKIPAGQVFVKLNTYHINLTKSFYSIDSVNLIDRRYFSQPLIGLLENKILSGVAPEVAGYPRFTSYELRNKIKNLYPGMDYEGGFSLQGLKVSGTGKASQKSVLIVYYKQKPLLRLASTYFSFQPTQARGINTEASIYIDTDSIYHPGLFFQYNGKQNEISLIRDGEGLSPSIFLNTYHKYDLDVALIHWRMSDNFMTMKGLMGSIENRATFESSDFFNIARYNEILIADKTHPVTAVKQCADYLYSRSYSLSDLSTFMKMPQHLVQEMLLRLSFLGFVRYNSETQLVEVQERAYDFLKKNAGLQDYDIIRFESVHKPPEANAQLSLVDNHLQVFWIKSLDLSQSRNVSIIPTQSTIEILKGRDILFDGEIQGGLIHFYGKQFRFHYDDFSISLGKVDKIQLKVVEKTLKNQKMIFADVTSVIENTRGVLKIDQPTNKSGLKVEDYPEYPILQTDTNAFVYYDQREILNGIYPRKTFNFNISPFTLKGLNLTSFSDSLVFPGQFITADIFPPIHLALRHQKDHSLGFDTLKTPEDGYPVYLGKGRFFENLSMSKAGLQGSGKLEYLNSILISENFLFLPDQVTSVVKSIAVSKTSDNKGSPASKGQEITVRWFPKRDQLLAQGTKSSLKMYDTGQFDGVMSLEPGTLTGNGTISFEGYSITSDKIRFNENSFDVVNGVLRIFKDAPTQKADSIPTEDTGSLMVGHQYNGTVDVENKKARFIPSESGSHIVFTKNRFEGKPAGFTWDITEGQLTMDTVNFKMAAKPSDSLYINSQQAGFDLKNLTINAHRVDYIDVADVRVFPVDQNVTIRKYAKIDSLMQATIVSRDTTLVHRITNATVLISDNKKYNAKGSYQYKDIAGREFPITFSDIQPDKKGISYGKGTISAERQFTLNPAFKYTGSVEWNNNERFLLFNGQTQLSHTCPGITLQWIKFNSRICPDSVAIPIDSITVNDQNERLFKGFFLSNQPIELYSTFIGPHTRYSDQPLISTYGSLWFDQSNELYKLSSHKKKANPEEDGPIIQLDVNTCQTEAKGLLNLGVDLGQVKIKGAGRITHDLKKDSITGSLMLTADFFFDPKILDYMSKSINEAKGLEPVNYADQIFRETFKDLVGRAKGDELLKQISQTGKWKKLPSELLHTIVFTDVNFKWNSETGSYQSTGKFGISNIMEAPVNKKVNGNLEIVHRRGGDSFTVYIEIDRQNYFFFTYSRGVMQCVAGSGFEKFNEMIRSTSESKLKEKTAPGEVEYQYYIGTYDQVRSFVRRFSSESK